MEDEDDFVECALCGREILESKAIYISGTPYCSKCHGEFDYDDEDDDEDDDWDDEDDDDDF